MTDRHRQLAVAEPDVGALEEKYLLDAFRSGWISSLGPYIQRFETELARFCHTSQAIAVSNGTTALHLALIAAGVGPGDEVIVPALTFAATAAAVRHAGADPVFVDSEPGIGTMSPAAVERAIGPRTKAIIPVHLYGHPADMDPISALATAHKLVVIEDAAEAHGALYKGRRVGSLGHMATFSFYGNKVISTGEGGAVVTSDGELAERVRFYKDHAMDPKRRYWHPAVGYNYRMTNLQAAIGCAQLERFEEIIGKRSRLLADYREAFAGAPLALNPAASWATPVPWLVCAVLGEGDGNLRDFVAAELRRGAIDSRPYFIPLSSMPPYRQFRRVSDAGDDVPVAAELSSRGLNLPSVTSIDRVDVERIKEAFSAAWAHRPGAGA